MTTNDAKDEALRMLKGWKPKPSWVCTCRYPPGKLRIAFTWRWPFIWVWRSKSHCLCEINAILDEILDITQAAAVQAPRLPQPDAAPVRPRGHLSLRKVWEGAKRLLRSATED